MPSSILGDLSLVAAIVGALVPAPHAPPIIPPRRTIAAMVKALDNSMPARLKRAFKRAEILAVSDRRLADAAGVSKTTVSRWRESGPGTFNKVEPGITRMEKLLEQESLALDAKRARLAREVER